MFTAQLLRERGLNRVLLVTSASHMPRSVAVFRKQGLEIIPSPTDVQVVARPFTLIQILPGLGALEYSNTALKEWFGLMTYRLRGWA